MAVLFDVPTIGSQASDFGQRGPTCWYYASKMLLKFHKKLDNKGDKIYAEMKTLHEIRKVMTETKADDGKAIAAELRRRASKLDGYARVIGILWGKPSLDAKQVESLQFLESASAPELKQRLAEAIRKLDGEAEQDTGRLNLLTSFVPTAGFHQVNKEQYDSPEKVMDLLERWGPFYTGGTVVASRSNIKPTGQQAGTTPIVSVSEFNATGSHAIVVVGATASTVYYKDPHKTDQIRSMDIKTFHKGLDVDASDFLIAINCWDGWNADEAQCTHVMRRRLAVPV